MAALAAAMGIGRFAFTPLLPMMLSDGVITLVDGSWLATANYVGYLLGALACMALPWVAPEARQRWHPARLARWGLAATVLLTLAMALPLPWAWAALRFGAGVASAVVLLNIAAWCMLRLVALGQPALGGLIFSGPGLGIALTGLSASAMVAWHWPAAAGWAVFRLLCVGLCALVWPVVRGLPQAAAAASSAPVANPPRPGARSARRAHAGLWFGGAGLHRHRHVFAGDCACCLACWLGVARLVLAAVWHGCGHGGRPVQRARQWRGTGAGCCWWLICCRPLRLV